MIKLVEPLKKVILEDTAYAGEEVEEKFFGGFCECGGLMLQKLWVQSGNKRILISECEKCWKNKAIVFSSFKFEEKRDVDVLNRHEFAEYLKNFLTDSEFEALLNKAKGREFQSIAYSNAKKKLLDMNFTIEEVLDILR